MGTPPQALIFDLGGVLVGFDGISPLIALSGGRLNEESARRFWLESTWVKAFETGKCNRHEFAGGLVAEAGFRISPEDFLLQFASWEKGCLPGALDLLSSLKGKIPLACLSNNNELHWGLLKERYDIGRHFDHLFLSHQIGSMKPERAIYEHALSVLARSPGEVVFFDDNPECIRGAEAAGIPAIEVKGPSEVRAALAILGLPS